MEDKITRTLKSGAVIEVTLASFDEGQRLYEAVAREIAKVRLTPEVLGTDLDLKNATLKSFLTPALLDSGKTIILNLLCSQEIKAVLWQCLARGVYTKEGKTDKITPALFEPVANRGDYLIIAKEVLWFNLTPFFEEIVLSLKNAIQSA